MLFNSITFAIFFIVVFGLYWLLRQHYRKQNCLLLIASYIFYGWWDVRFLFLIVLATVVDYCSSITLDKGKLSLGQKFKGFSALLGSCLVFVTLDWNAVHFTIKGHLPSISINWQQLCEGSSFGWHIFGVAAAGIVAYNIVHVLTKRLRPEVFRKVHLFVSIILNLGILGFFKYFNFFAESFAEVYKALFHASPGDITLHIILPVGISFFTFQTMSHTIDVFRKKIPATESLLELAVYVSFFPQLVAGPIERGEHLLPQFQKPRTWHKDEWRHSVWLIFWGLFKKLVVADNLAVLVNSTFAPFDHLSGMVSVPDDGLRILIAIYAFSFQIYCDFSGYTDIARGVAKLLGFDIMLNFNLPYFATTPSDFWRRWHISLSSWLRDYLYIPLGGNRGKGWFTYRNLMITMVLGGLWHGAAWTFVLWGGFHGIILSIYRLLGVRSEKNSYSWWQSMLLGLIMFHLVCLGWLLFRAQNLATIQIFLQSIILHPYSSPAAMEALKTLLFYTWFLILFQIVQYKTGSLDPLARMHWFVRLNIWIFVIMSLMSLAARGGQEFIYFAF